MRLSEFPVFLFSCREWSAPVYPAPFCGLKKHSEFDAEFKYANNRRLLTPSPNPPFSGPTPPHAAGVGSSATLQCPPGVGV